MTLVLLRRARQGDRIARGDLFRRELPWIEGLVRRRLHGVNRLVQDTGDVIGELAVRVLERSPHFEVDGRSRFQALLACMTVNQLLTRARRETRRLPAGVERVVLDLDTGAVSHDIAQPEAAAQAEECAWSMLAVEFLQPIDQDVVHLRLWEDLEFKAIGAELGLKPDAARMRYNRAMEELRALVEECKAGKLPTRLDRIALGLGPVGA